VGEYHKGVHDAWKKEIFPDLLDPRHLQLTLASPQLVHDEGFIQTMPIKLSERAAEEVKRFQTEHSFGEDMVLRIGIAAGGCSGFSYTLNFDDKYDENADTKYECHGVAVVVDKKSALYLDGTTVDWYESLEKQGFTFENPNAVKSCGCGSSFQA
jgi:iron-sulfur cluster assembly protein